MGASYSARWICPSHIADLPSHLLPHLLAEGYDLLAYEQSKQIFDRGGVMRKIPWSLNGGRWCDAPVDLSITYSHVPAKTIVDFQWSLAVRPFPTTQKEQASFEAWVREQFGRIAARLSELLDTLWPNTASSEPANLQEGLPDRHYADDISDKVVGADVAMLTHPVRQRTSVQYASTYVEQPPRCDRCWKPAVAIPGTTGRYYCLTCHRHLPRQASVQQK